MPTKVEKRLCFHQLLPPFPSNILVSPPIFLTSLRQRPTLYFYLTHWKPQELFTEQQARRRGVRGYAARVRFRGRGRETKFLKVYSDLMKNVSILSIL